MAQYDAILVPGGFDSVVWKARSAHCNTLESIAFPRLGICLGMQVATIEYATSQGRPDRCELRSSGPNTPHPVINLID